MSWKATAFVKHIREGVTRSEKLLLLILADYHNEETGQCDPSHETLAADSLLSKQQVIRLLKSLDSKTLLHIQERRIDGHQATNQYDLICLDQSNTTLLSPKRQSNKQSNISGQNQPKQSNTMMLPEPSSGEKPQEKNRNVAMSPDLKEALLLWKNTGLGPVSMSATTKLRKLIANHGIALVLEGIQKSADQAITYPISWMETAIPGWKRERGRNGTNTANNQRLTGGAGVHTRRLEAYAERVRAEREREVVDS